MAIGINQLQQAPWSGLGPQSVHTINTGVCSNTGVGGMGIYQVSQSGVSYPSGTIITILFTDAHGQNWALDVDPIYAQTLSQISQAHQMKAQYQYAPGQYATPTPPNMAKPIPMMDGYFTEDEMELAENLIAELEGGDKKGPRQNIQEDISCEA